MGQVVSFHGTSEEAITGALSGNASPVYVDAALGNDDTGNGSAIAPYKSLDQALAAVASVDGPVVMFLSDGSYTMDISWAGIDEDVFLIGSSSELVTVSVSHSTGTPTFILAGASGITFALASGPLSYYLAPRTVNVAQVFDHCVFDVTNASLGFGNSAQVAIGEFSNCKIVASSGGANCQLVAVNVNDLYSDIGGLTNIAESSVPATAATIRNVYSEGNLSIQANNAADIVCKGDLTTDVLHLDGVQVEGNFTVSNGWASIKNITAGSGFFRITNPSSSEVHPFISNVTAFPSIAQPSGGNGALFTFSALADNQVVTIRDSKIVYTGVYDEHSSSPAGIVALVKFTNSNAVLNIENCHFETTSIGLMLSHVNSAVDPGRETKTQIVEAENCYFGSIMEATDGPNDNPANVNVRSSNGSLFRARRCTFELDTTAMTSVAGSRATHEHVIGSADQDGAQSIELIDCIYKGTFKSSATVKRVVGATLTGGSGSLNVLIDGGRILAETNKSHTFGNAVGSWVFRGVLESVAAPTFTGSAPTWAGTVKTGAIDAASVSSVSVVNTTAFWVDYHISIMLTQGTWTPETGLGGYTESGTTDDRLAFHIPVIPGTKVTGVRLKFGSTAQPNVRIFETEAATASVTSSAVVDTSTNWAATAGSTTIDVRSTTGLNVTMTEGKSYIVTLRKLTTSAVMRVYSIGVQYDDRVL